MNRSTSFWGPNAKEFKPERWLDDESGVPEKAKEVQGYHHLLTFVDGPRTCLGKGFALAEFKVSFFYFTFYCPPKFRLNEWCTYRTPLGCLVGTHT